jgi:repressor LexA
VLLSPVQEKIAAVFRDAASAGAAPPTLRELCAHFGWRSTGTARDHLRALVRKGVLRRERGARNYRVVGASGGAAVPIVGRVSAGSPVLALEHRDGDVTVPAAWTRGRAPAFAVRVDGESMVGAGILDGDIVVARATADVRDGQIVVARIGDVVTVKRLRLRGRRSLLVPENAAFAPIEVTDDTSVDGVVVGLVRDVVGARTWRGGQRWDH